jgi:outer membrane immunogenic protein
MFEDLAMKKLALAAAAATLVSGAAVAADLPTAKGPPPAPVVYAPAFTWTGFYVGINGGGAWEGSNNSSYYLYDPLFANTGENGYLPYLASSGGNRSGWLIGGTVGYNYQFGVGSGFVIGVEADLDYLSNNNKNRSAFYDNSNLGLGPPYDWAGTYAAYGSGSGSNYFGTIRARLGWAFDHFLVYATGGFAFLGTGNSGIGAISYWLPGDYALGQSPDATFFVGRSSSNHYGWTIGAGAEYAITNNWTIKAEYLYVSRSGGNNNGAYGGCVDGYVPGTCALIANHAAYWYNNAKNDANANIVRVGVNYKF